MWDSSEGAHITARAVLAQHGFETTDTEYRGAFADLVRLFTHRTLREKKQHLPGLLLQSMSRNGVAFGFNGRNCRVRSKDRYHTAPRAGHSATMIKFLGQQLFLPGMVDLAVAMIPSRLILAETDKAFNFKRLWFGLPLSGSVHGQTVCYWMKPLDFGTIAQFGVPSSQPQIDDDEGGNLDYELVLESEYDEESGGATSTHI
jgi:hypothetical protein